ncbi:hypothetical protein [Streptomyces nigra]|uniref:hypothetical protein n=1 Tax=Streptomyces nigra TaxID=1827580 RepID=UPI00363FD2DC
MDTAQVALVVSSFTGTVALGSFATAYATYRRGRPRVKLGAAWGTPPNGLRVYGGMPESEIRNVMHMQVVNRGATSVEIRAFGAEFLFRTGRSDWRVHLGWIRSNPWYFIRHGIRRTRAVLDAEDERFVAGPERPAKLEPFAGERWAYTLFNAARPNPKTVVKVRMLALLSDGSQVHSKWLSVRDLRAADDRLLSMIVTSHGVVVTQGAPLYADGSEQIPLFED